MNISSSTRPCVSVHGSGVGVSVGAGVVVAVGSRVGVDVGAGSGVGATVACVGWQPDKTILAATASRTAAIFREPFTAGDYSRRRGALARLL